MPRRAQSVIEHRSAMLVFTYTHARTHARTHTYTHMYIHTRTYAVRQKLHVRYTVFCSFIPTMTKKKYFGRNI